MSQAGQAPDRAQHGSSLQQSSVGGQKVSFVEGSDSAAGRLTLQAAGDGSLQDFGYFHLNLDIVVDDNTLNSFSVLGWNYAEFYIDSASTDTFLDSDYYRVGATATSTRGKQSLNIFEHRQVFNIGHTLGTYWFCQNLDSSSHTIDGLTFWKYIRTGDEYVA